MYLILLENMLDICNLLLACFMKKLFKNISDINKNILFTNNQAQNPLTVIMLQLLFTTSLLINVIFFIRIRKLILKFLRIFFFKYK